MWIYIYAMQIVISWNYDWMVKGWFPAMKVQFYLMTSYACDLHGNYWPKFRCQGFHNLACTPFHPFTNTCLLPFTFLHRYLFAPFDIRTINNQITSFNFLTNCSTKATSFIASIFFENKKIKLLSTLN